MNDFKNSQSGADLFQEAEAFLSCMADDKKACLILNRGGGMQGRLEEIARDIQATGTYEHTFGELQFGARLA